MGGQNGISGKESYGLYQNVPRGDVGCHLPTCRKFLSKTDMNMSFLNTLHTTHQCIPLFYIIKGINTNVEVSHKAEDLNPR